MTVTVIRWKGGYGGDMLMNLINMSGLGQICNIGISPNLDSNGKIVCDFSNIDFKMLTEVKKLGFMELLQSIDLQKLDLEINDLKSSDQNTWIKSHLYTTDMFDDITVDIVPDHYSLPFIGSANIEKTETAKKKLNELSGIIGTKDPLALQWYNFYMVLQDSLVIKDNGRTRKISVSDIISGFDTLETCCRQAGIALRENCRGFYNQWYYLNKQYFPSDQYIKQIDKKDYSISNDLLTVEEKYSLLAIRKEKFKILW